MSDIGAKVAELIAAGCDPAVAARVIAEVYVAGVKSAPLRVDSQVDIRVDETAEKRRAWEREYRRKKRVDNRNIHPNPPDIHPTPGGVHPHPPDTPSLSIEEEIFITPLEREVAGGQSTQKPSRSKPRSRLPDGWQLSEADGAYAVERGFDASQIGTMFERFCNHHRMKGSVMACWHAAWRTWVGNDLKYAGERNGRGAVQNRTNTALGRDSDREARLLAAMARGVDNWAASRGAAGPQWEIPTDSGPPKAPDADADADWIDLEARCATR